MEKKDIIHNRYLVLNEISSGKLTTVYRAWDHTLEKIVAIKKINTTDFSSPTILETIREEILNAARLQHPNILHVFDCVKAIDNTCYVVMEYVIGKDLSSLMARCKSSGKPFPSDIALYIINSIAQALCYAYEIKDSISGEPSKLTHLDICPQNILLHTDGRVKLSDFGIAKAIYSEIRDDENFQDVFKNKYHYMPLEQFVGKPTDFSSDLFSLGIIFYELLTANKPFDGQTEQEIGEKMIESRPDMSGIPPEIQPIISILLEKVPENRFKSPMEFLEALKPAVESLVSAEKIQETTSKFLKENFSDFFSIEDEEREIIKNSISQSSLHEAIEIEKPPTPIMTHRDKIEKTAIAQPGFSESINPRLIAGAIIGAALFLFFEFFIDIPNAVSPLGSFIQSIFFPLTAHFDTLPSGANIQLLNVNNEDVIRQSNSRGITPTKISDVMEGDYKLVITKEGFNDIVRNIKISKSQALGKNKNRIEFMIPFEVPMLIKSVPGDADIYIDGKMIKAKTPYITMLAARPHAIGLSKEGFEFVGSKNIFDAFQAGKCNIDFSKPQHDMDTDIWSIEISSENGQSIQVITGKLLKQITIESEPSGAEVYYVDNNKFIGTTPLQQLFRAGDTEIKLVKANYRPVKTTISYNDPKKDKFVFNLVRQKASVYINTDPPGASVKLINSSDQNLTEGRESPVKLTDAKYGEYTLIIKKKGFDEIRKIINIDEAKASEKGIDKIEFNIPLTVTVNFVSNPEGATVLLNGSPYPDKTPCKATLTAGTYAVLIKKEGLIETGSMEPKNSDAAGKCILDFKESNNSMDTLYWELKTPQGSSTEYTLTGSLRKEITFDSNPRGAQIYIIDGGKSLGRTPITAIFKTGITKVRVFKENYGIIVREIRVGYTEEETVMFNLIANAQ